MRFAVVSDIHANLQAWNAVHIELCSLKVDRIICLGDLVGYGPNPAEVLQAMHSQVHHFVLGNHDAALCGKLSEDLFNDRARSILDWTRAQVGPEALGFLRGFPLTLDGGLFRCAHADFGRPGAFNYVIEPADAVASWQAVKAQLLFVGHTHRPALFVLGASGTPHAVPPQDFELEQEKRYLVNVGSVGQPRDGEARAAYCIYDDAARAVFWRRVPFDLDAYRRAVREAGIDEQASYFLQHDPRAAAPALRSVLNFTPARTPQQAARDVVEVQAIAVLQRRVATWQRRFGLLLAVVLVAAGAAAGILYRQATRGSTLSDPDRPAVLDAGRAEAGANILPPLAPMPGGLGVKGWTLRMGDKRRQRCAWTRTDEGGDALQLESATRRDDIRLVSPPIAVLPRTRMYPCALFRKSADFDGEVAVHVSLTRTEQGRRAVAEEFYVKTPTRGRKGGWQQAAESFEIPANAASIEIQIRARFTGRVEISGVSLVHR